MEPSNKIKKLFDFFMGYRRSGTTSLIKKIAEENDVYVLVANEHKKNLFPKNGITLMEACRDWQTMDKKPVLVDNHTMGHILEVFMEELEHREQGISERDRLLNTVEHIISDFRRNGTSKMYHSHTMETNIVDKKGGLGSFFFKVNKQN